MDEKKTQSALVAAEQKTAFIASIVMASAAVVIYFAPNIDETAREWFWRTLAKTAIATFMLSVGWVPIRRAWSMSGGKAAVIGIFVCVLVAAFRPKAVFIVFPIVVIATGMYLTLVWSERFFRRP